MQVNVYLTIVNKYHVTVTLGWHSSSCFICAVHYVNISLKKLAFGFSVSFPNHLLKLDYKYIQSKLNNISLEKNAVNMHTFLILKIAHGCSPFQIINLFMLNEISHYYRFDQAIFWFKGCWVIVCTFIHYHSVIKQ